MILAYHRINPWYKKDALSVHPDIFEKQIEYLIEKGFKNVPINKHKQGEKNFVITFDDGFYDNYLYGFDIFKKFNLKPIIFLIAGFIGSNKIWPRYKNFEKDRFLKWEEVEEMLKEGVEFGSHTLTHPDLTKIPEEKIREEIINSKKLIEDKTGREILYFCYPFGRFNQKVIEIVKEAGYKGAVITPSKDLKIKNSDFTMIRIGIYGHNNFLVYRIKIWKSYLKERYF